MDVRKRGFVRVASDGEIAPGSVAVVEVDGRSLCVGHLEDGGWGAIENVCTHDGGTLGEGELEGSCVECPRHGARFDIFTGEVRALPAVLPVVAYPAREVDGAIEVNLDPPGTPPDV